MGLSGSTGGTGPSKNTLLSGDFRSLVTHRRTSSITAIALISSVLGMRRTLPVSVSVNWLCRLSLPLMNGMP